MGLDLLVIFFFFRLHGGFHPQGWSPAREPFGYRFLKNYEGATSTWLVILGLIKML